MAYHFNLTRRIALAAALMTLLTTALIGGVAFVIMRAQVMESMQQSLDHSSGSVADDLEHRLNTIADTLANLAANTLVANALVDNEGRQRYLNGFLDSYQTISALPVTLALTDYAGRPLSSGARQRLHFAPQWIAAHVEQNTPGSTLVQAGDSNWLVLAQPVIYANTGLPEGALVLQIDMAELTHSPLTVAPTRDWQHMASFSLHIDDGDQIAASFTIGSSQVADGVGQRQALALAPQFEPLLFELEVEIDPYRFNAPLRQLLLSATILALFSLLLVAIFSIFIGRTLTRRLHQLEETAHHISLVSSVRPRLPVSGHDEVAGLARSFNRLLDDLQVAFDELQQKSRSLANALEEAGVARSEAEAANRAKSTFLANMSHELRTPLNAILGFAQILEHDSSLGEEQRRSLATIYRSGQHLLSLINDVLEISRIEAGRIELSEGPFDLQELLTAVTDLMRLRASEKGVELQLQIDDEVPECIEADQRKLRQVLLNLLGNAVKFTDEGWVRLSVALSEGELAIEVADSGQGIAEADLQRIFEPFFQSSGRHQSEGTGLGLTITAEFLQMMGGAISIDSRLGEGTTFHIHLPLRPATSEPLMEGRGAQRVIGLLPDQTVRRVLVVDDKPEGRDLLCHLLDSVGFEVRSAENGREAIDVFHGWRPHLIWMDMRMPVMDGYEATRRIKAEPHGEETIIVALTASAFEEDREAVLAAGCDHFMRKPIDSNEVFEVMARFLGVGYRYAPAKVAAPPPPAEASVDLAAAVAQLPAGLCAPLVQAATALDVEASRTAIAAIAAHDPALAGHLSALAGQYRYDELARLCAPGGEPHSKQVIES